MKNLLFSQPNVIFFTTTSPSVAWVPTEQLSTYLAAGWVAAATVGRMNERPYGATANSLHFDVDGQRLLIHDGVQWRDASTGEYLN
jgi:hypothetical protein